MVDCEGSQAAVSLPQVVDGVVVHGERRVVEGRNPVLPIAEEEQCDYWLAIEDAPIGSIWLTNDAVLADCGESVNALATARRGCGAGHQHSGAVATALRIEPIGSWTYW